MLFSGTSEYSPAMCISACKQANHLAELTTISNIKISTFFRKFLGEAHVYLIISVRLGAAPAFACLVALGNFILT